MYLGTILLIVVLITTGILIYYKPTPDCFDGKKNQNELGIDCGGICSKACSSQISKPIVWWTSVLPLETGKYDVASLIENQNATFGVREVEYLIRLFDKFNVLITERKGTTFLNPQEKFVVYEPNIETGEKVPVRAALYFDDAVSWQKMRLNDPGLNISSITYNNEPRPRLEAKVTNTSLEMLRNTKFVAVLTDSAGNAVGASQTVVDALAGKETKDLIFTWPEKFDPEPVVRDIYPKLYLFNDSFVE